MKNAKIKTIIDLQFDGQIFNLLCDNEAGVLALEIRNNAKYNASYAAFDLKKNKFINKKIQPAERWWTSMLSVNKESLILYQYHDQQSPDVKDIFALDLKKGKQLWLHHQVILQNVENEKLTVLRQNDDNIENMIITLPEGKLKPFSDDVVQQKIDKIEQPQHYKENSEYFDTVSKFVNKKYNISPIKAVDYLEVKEFIIISYYLLTNEGKSLNNELLVLNEQGEILLKEKLAKDLKGIGMDTFVIINGLLIMIKDKNTLKGYKLY